MYSCGHLKPVEKPEQSATGKLDKLESEAARDYQASADPLRDQRISKVNCRDTVSGVGLL